MYGGSKESGQLVGRVQTQAVQVDVGEAADGTGCHESLRCQDDDGNELTLSAKLDPGSGELVWIMEQLPTKSRQYYLRPRVVLKETK